VPITVKPYKAEIRTIDLPKDTNAWHGAIANIVTETLGGITPSEMKVQFKKMQQESLSAVGSAGVVIEGKQINFPLIVVGGKMFPLDIAVDQDGNRFPWHPFFISLIPSDSFEVVNKRACGLFSSERLQAGFIKAIVKMPKPAGFKEALKEAMSDSSTMVGLIKNGAKDVILKMLVRPEINKVTKSVTIKNASSVPNISPVPSKVYGPSCVATNKGIKRAIGFSIVGNDKKNIVLSNDGCVCYNDELISSRINSFKMACDSPAGYGAFYGIHKRRYMSTEPMNVLGSGGGSYSCMDNAGNSVRIKIGSELKKDGDTITIPSKWKFIKIKDVMSFSNDINYGENSVELRQNGMSYYLGGNKIAVGRDNAVAELSKIYSNAQDIIKSAAKHGSVLVPKIPKPQNKQVKFNPLVDDFIKIASMVPNQYSAAAILDIGLPIRESINQMRKHIGIYQLAAAALANDTLLARLTGNQAEAEMSAAMSSVCDAGMTAVDILRLASSEQTQ